DASYEPVPSRLALRTLVDPFSHQDLDRALVCFFKQPKSYTGEDLVELHCHGSPVLLRTTLHTIVQLGARLADAGEFSFRAVQNGRLLLTDAEAIRDLINAKTEAAVRQATRQLKGELSHTLQPAKNKLVEVIARLE